jgi:CheY-like chemotaxis protein
MVSVNNGEAAVRKLADVSPDLVLADIFMPVRNGYEVCEYIKKDPRFAHVPVILLVGAFDPLDEREAQRVGADGILKKPFVPPEPLITMVKTLLDRSMGERLVAVSVSNTPVAMSVSKTPAAVHAKTGNEAIAETRVLPPPMPDEPSTEEFPVSAGRVIFGEGDHPVAFGQLLETPARATSASGTDVVEPVDDEQILTSSRDATLGEPVFWRNDSPETEPEAEPSAERQDGLSLHKWGGQDEDSLPRREDAALLRPLEPLEPLELVREEQEETSPSIIDSEPVVLDPAAQSALTVEPGKAPELAANPIEWLATAPVQHPDPSPETTPGWDEQIADAFKSIDAVKPSEHSEAVAETDTRSAEEPAAKISQQLPQAPEDTARSVPITKWAEMTESLQEHAHELEAPHAVSISVPSAQVLAPAQTSSESGAVNPLQSSSPEVIPDPIVKWADMTESLEGRAHEFEAPHAASISVPPALVPAPTQASSESDAVSTLQAPNPAASSNPSFPPSPAATLNLAAFPSPAESPIPAASQDPSESAAPDPALVEAVVQRVLDKMRPQVVDIITREFLRPVVQALVHREIEKH